MQVDIARSWLRDHAGAMAAIGITVVALLAGMSIALPGFGAAAAIIAVGLVGLLAAQNHPTMAVNLAIAVGLSAGISRRMLEYFAPGSGLVAVIVLLPGVIIAGALLWSRKAANTQPGGKVPLFWVLLVGAVILAGINPAGAGPVANAATSGLLVVYVLGFLLTFQSKISFSNLVLPLVLVGTINSLYMIAQHFWGLTPWDRLWVATDGYAALYLTETEVRPLGISSSAAESAALCALVFVLSLFSVKYARPPAKAPYACAAVLALIAVTLSGTRTFLILSVLGFAVIIAAGTKRPRIALLTVLATLVPTVVLISSRLSGVEASGAARSLNTFSGGEDMSTSTIPIHLDLLVNGLLRGLASVVGSGSGQLGTLAGKANSAEIDLGNLPLMAGVLGGAAAVTMYFLFFKKLHLILKEGGPQVFSALVLVAVLGQWLTVGFYGVLGLVWLAFGEFCRVSNVREKYELDDIR